LQSWGDTRLEGAKGWEGRERVPGRWLWVLKGYRRGLRPPGRGCREAGQGWREAVQGMERARAGRMEGARAGDGGNQGRGDGGSQGRGWREPGQGMERARARGDAGSQGRGWRELGERGWREPGQGMERARAGRRRDMQVAEGGRAGGMQGARGGDGGDQGRGWRGPRERMEGTRGGDGGSQSRGWVVPADNSGWNLDWGISGTEQSGNHLPTRRSRCREAGAGSERGLVATSRGQDTSMPGQEPCVPLPEPPRFSSSSSAAWGLCWVQGGFLLAPPPTLHRLGVCWVDGWLVLPSLTQHIAPTWPHRGMPGPFTMVSVCCCFHRPLLDWEAAGAMRDGGEGSGVPHDG